NGEFSNLVYELVEKVTFLRIYVEAAIDFPEEEIDFLQDKKIQDKSLDLTSSMAHLLKKAKQGSLLREGVKVVIAGKPNAGKSSLLNVLAGKDAAIVTDVEGTTRDVLTELINLDGLPLHIIDTAGLRKAKDKVEQIGIEKAVKQIEEAHLVLWVVDATDAKDDHTDIYHVFSEFTAEKINLPPVLKIINKIDLVSNLSRIVDSSDNLNISTRTKTGIETLKVKVKDLVGYKSSESGVFMARRRHLTALEKAKKHIDTGLFQLKEYSAGELLAEELKLAQEALNEITGEFTPDDLLGRIFTSFCIGK
ncbi:MAG: tRNA modification GTPase, partial [Kangiellaceae bacterium]